MKKSMIFLLAIVLSVFSRPSVSQEVSIPVDSLPPFNSPSAGPVPGLELDMTLGLELKGSKPLVHSPSGITVVNSDGESSVTHKSPSTSIEGLETTTMSAPPQYSFSECSPFTLGNGLYAVLENQGDLACFNTYSPDEIKVVAQATNQPSGVNFDLYLYFYNHDTGNLEFYASSTAAGNVDEFAAALMPAGNYILYVEATSGGSQDTFIVGAVGYPDYDAYEENDSPSTATSIQSNIVVEGNTDYAGDLDHFLYTTGSNQVEVDITFDSPNHVLQVYSTNGWVSLPSGYMSLTVPSSSDVLFRIGNVANPNDTSVDYLFAISRPAYQLENTQMTNDENLQNVGLGLEAHSRITFNGTVTDENGIPVPYGRLPLLVKTVTDGNILETGVANENGVLEHTVHFTPCTGGGYYGEGSSGRTNPPSFQYPIMSTSVGFFQLCSP